MGTITRNSILNVDFVPVRVRRQRMSEPKLQMRDSVDVGWVLSPTGATVEDAVATTRITNPANRQLLIRKGFKILTRHNSNDTPRDYHGDPPTLDTCKKVIALVATRKEKALEFLQDQLDKAKEEPLADLPPGDRSFWRGRIKDLEKAVARVRDEDVTPEELHRAFRRDEVLVRNKEVDPAMRSQIEAFQNAQEQASALAEEDAQTGLGDDGDWSRDDYDPAADGFEDGEERASDEVL